MKTDDTPEEKRSTLHLPRILCLHGGGVNANVFRLQSRSLIFQLQSSFRFVFADAPFVSEPHPAIIPVYKEYGPFYSWFPRLSEHAVAVDGPTAVINKIDDALKTAMDKDDCKGGTGEWVALMGFSQGAMLAASLLYRQQVREEKLGESRSGSDYRFAVVLAGRAPLVCLDPELIVSPALVNAHQIAMNFPRWSNGVSSTELDHKLWLPTIHVHGLQDPGLDQHRRLLDQYCEPGTTKLVVWDGDHRVPIKTLDVAAVVEKIAQVARETGVFKA